MGCVIDSLGAVLIFSCTLLLLCVMFLSSILHYLLIEEKELPQARYYFNFIGFQLWCIVILFLFMLCFYFLLVEDWNGSRGNDVYDLFAMVVCRSYNFSIRFSVHVVAMERRNDLMMNSCKRYYFGFWVLCVVLISLLFASILDGSWRRDTCGGFGSRVCIIWWVYFNTFRCSSSSRFSRFWVWLFRRRSL